MTRECPMGMGRPRSEGRRWETKFGAWVSRFTVTRITSELSARGVGVQDKTVYSWVAATRFPRVDHAMALVEISGGRLKVDDVYRHRVEVRGDDDRVSGERSGSAGSVVEGAAVGTRRD